MGPKSVGPHPRHPLWQMTPPRVSSAAWCKNNHDIAFCDKELKFGSVMEEVMERKTDYREKEISSIFRALTVQCGLHSEEKGKIWSKMSYYFIAWSSNASINLTGYHPPSPSPLPPSPANPRPLFFYVKIPTPGTVFQCKTPAPGSKKRNKIPTPGRNLPSWNAKISMKRNIIIYKQFLSKFSIIVPVPFDNFFYCENKVFASLYTATKINTAIMQ